MAPTELVALQLVNFFMKSPTPSPRININSSILVSSVGNICKQFWYQIGLELSLQSKGLSRWY